MKRVSMTLTVDVAYTKDDDTDFTEAELWQLRSNLDYLPQHAAGNGGFTDDASNVTVDMWSNYVTMPKTLA